MCYRFWQAVAWSLRRSKVIVLRFPLYQLLGDDITSSKECEREYHRRYDRAIRCECVVAGEQTRHVARVK